MKKEKKSAPKQVKTVEAVAPVEGKFDLIKTINEDDEVENLSEESDVEVEVSKGHLHRVFGIY